MKKNKVLSVLTILFFGVLFSCQDNKIVPDNDSQNLNSKDFETLRRVRTLDKRNSTSALKNARLSSNGLD